MIRSATLILIGSAILISGFAIRAEAQVRDLAREMRLRGEEQRRRDRMERFIEDTYKFFEISGELVSFRVHPNMSDTELDAIEERSRELDDMAARLISFVSIIAPYVRGSTDGLWVVLDPPDENTSLEDRLTLILALSNRMNPKIEQLTTMLTQQLEPTIPVEDLQLEASAPYLIVGGLEELRSMTRDLRRTF